jgi:hypothetical protein
MEDHSNHPLSCNNRALDRELPERLIVLSSASKEPCTRQAQSEQPIDVLEHKWSLISRETNTIIAA